MNLSVAQLRDLAASFGFPDPAMAAAVAMVESYGDPTATNICPGHPGCGPLPERSFGLWQINTLAHRQYNETSLLDPQYNARAAYDVSKGGTDWSAWWTTLRTGGYKQYLPAGYVPPQQPVVLPPPNEETITPPATTGNVPVILGAMGALALATAAGYAVYEATRRRTIPIEPPPQWSPPIPSY